MKKKKIPNRIPFNVWINSQMSIAQHYGGLKINGKLYQFDQFCKPEPNGKYKPDLVEVV